MIPYVCVYVFIRCSYGLSGYRAPGQLVAATYRGQRNDQVQRFTGDLVPHVSGQPLDRRRHQLHSELVRL